MSQLCNCVTLSFEKSEFATSYMTYKMCDAPVSRTCDNDICILVIITLHYETALSTTAYYKCLPGIKRMKLIF